MVASTAGEQLGHGSGEHMFSASLKSTVNTQQSQHSCLCVLQVVKACNESLLLHTRTMYARMMHMSTASIISICDQNLAADISIDRQACRSCFLG